MTKNIDIIHSQAAQFAQWLTQQEEPSILTRGQRQILVDKTSLLGKSQNLAAEAKAILLSELDNENTFNMEMEQDISIPSLPTPQTRAKALNQNGKATELLSTLMMLSSEVSLNELSLQLSNLMASYESYRKTSNELDKELEKYIDKAEQAKDAVAGAEKELEGLKDKLSDIQDKISKKQQEMSKMDTSSPEYKIAKDELNQLKQAEVSAQKAVQDQTTVLKEKMDVAAKAVSKATKALEKQSEFADKQSVGHIGSSKQTQRSNAARLSELIAYFMQLINKNSETELESQMSVFESMQKSVQSEMEKKANEIEEQERKAQELQKTMGCIGKIIGAIVTVVSVVSAAFTGGTSLALAGVGLALMGGDYIAEAASGQSLTERIMAPFMEYIFLPLMGLVEKVIDKVLEYTPLGQLLDLIGDAAGVDITGIAKTAISALATIALIVAVAYVAKSAVKAVTEKLFGSVFEKVLKNMIPKVTSDLVKQVSQNIVKGLGEVAAKVGLKNKATAARALKLQKLMQYLSYGNQGAQVTSNVIVADFKEKAVESMASLKISQTDLDNIRKVLESVIAAFDHSQSTYRDLSTLISDSRHTESNTGKQVLSNMRV